MLGLELVRNCETHSPLLTESLLVRSGLFGVPSSRCGTIMRSVYRWAEYADLPALYKDLAASATQTQYRARAEAQDGYRKAVQGRPVAETIFDALAFFCSLDGRLVGTVGPRTRWAFAEQGFAELPNTDPRFEEPAAWFLARPMGMDQFEPYLPDLACRYFERRTALWPAADDFMKQRVAQARKQPPAGQAREVAFIIRADDATLGFGGYADSDGAARSIWVERRAQVWRDVHRGFRYFVIHNGTEIDLRGHGHQQVGAFDAGAHDLLEDLPIGVAGFDAARLKMVEEYPDLYLQMRTRL